MVRTAFVTIFSIIFMMHITASHSSVLYEGIQAESAEEWQQALSIYLRELEKNPNNITLWLRIADIQHHLKQDTLTINAYQHAISIQPNNPILHKKLSEIYAANNQPQNALTELNEAIRLKPNDIDYLLTRAKLANWNKNIKLAIESYQEVLSQHDAPNMKLNRHDILMQIQNLQNQLHQNNKITLSPFEQSMAIANHEAVRHHYALAIEATKHAMQLSSQDSMLYKKLSELYAQSQQKKLALKAINQATRLQPSNLSYLRAQAVLAAWNEDKQQTLATNKIILNLYPLDETALLNLAHTLAWQGKTDLALAAYQKLLLIYPKNAEGLIQYADVLSWVGNHIQAMDALNQYQAIKGKTRAYYKTKARILVLIGRYQSALALNAPLIRTNPNDIYLLSTKALIETKSLQRNNALNTLNKLNQLTTDDPYVKGLNDIIITPTRTNFNLEGDYTGATDTTKIEDFPISVQYFINPTTSILMQGLFERATAALNSGLEAVNGKQSIFDESVRVGFTKQIKGINLTGLIGALKIQNKNEHAIYDAIVTTNLDETTQITIESLTNLFRPYLVPQTPRSISLQVMENRNGLSLQWQPLTQQYLNIISTYSTLSDYNHYWHNNIWPKSRVYGSEHWLVSLGIDADLWSFSRRATDGYYSPLFFQGYEGTIELYYSQSENIGYGFTGGFGMQKDEQLPHFFYEEDINASLFYGIYQYVELQLRAGYTLRANNSIKNYQCWSGGIILTQRFE